MLYGAWVALVCSGIMLAGNSIGAWLDDGAVSFERELRPFAVLFAVFFVAASGLFVLNNYRDQLR